MKGPRQKLVFVNKTAESETLSQSSGQERTQIFSHVQRGHQKASNRLATRSRETLAGPGRQRSKPQQFRTSGQGPGAQELGAREQTESEAAAASTVTAAGTEALIRFDRWEELSSKVLNSPLSPRTSSIMADLEPRIDEEAAIKPYLVTILGFYESQSMRRVFPEQLMVDSSRQQTFLLAAKDAVFRNALVCTASSTLFLMSGQPHHEENSMYFKGKALSQLRKQLSSESTGAPAVSTVFAISLLLWAECIQGNTSHVVAHVGGLQQLLGRWNDKNVIPLPIMTTVIGASYLCSAMLRTQPGPAPRLAERNQLRQEFIDGLDSLLPPSLQALASGFFIPSNRAVIGEDLILLIARQRTCLISREMSIFNLLDLQYLDMQAIYSEQLRIDYELLSIPFKNQPAEMTAAQDVIRIAMYVISRPIITTAGPDSAFARSIMQQLMEALECSEITTLWMPCFDLLLWVLFVAAYVSDGSGNWAWIIHHISQLICVLDLNSIEAFEEALQPFFYVKSQFCDTIEKVWADAYRPEWPLSPRTYSDL